MLQITQSPEEKVEYSDADLEPSEETSVLREEKVEGSDIDSEFTEEVSALAQDVNAQDEDEMTSLHRVATSGASTSRSFLGKRLRELFSHAELDFTIKDKFGNTPLHAAAACCEDRDTCLYLFPKLIAEASRRGFDFSTLGQGGQTVLHKAVMTTYTNFILGAFAVRTNNVLNVLKNAENPGINVLSQSGSTAFYYAVNHLNLEEADSLLDAGADPALYGAPDRNPFGMIDEHILTVKNTLDAESSDPETADQDKIHRCQHILNRLNALKGRMHSIVAQKSVSEVNKNAMVLALGNRGASSFFNRLPSEALIKIAGLTATNGVHTQDEAEEIAGKIPGLSLFSPVVNAAASATTVDPIVKSHRRCAYPLSI